MRSGRAETLGDALRELTIEERGDVRDSNLGPGAVVAEIRDVRDRYVELDQAMTLRARLRVRIQVPTDLGECDARIEREVDGRLAGPMPPIVRAVDIDELVRVERAVVGHAAVDAALEPGSWRAGHR
jgi:hypothetical protein